MLYWIAKSAPRPTNSTANAIEIGLKAPTSRMPAAAVTIRPTARLTMTAATSRSDRSESHRIKITIAPVIKLLSARPSFTLRNSSSEIGTGPVRRAVAPKSDCSLRSVIACLTAVVALPPGSTAVWSRTVQIWIMWRSPCGGPSCRSSFQENEAGRLRSTSSSVAVARFSGRAMESSETYPCFTLPSIPDNTSMAPRRLWIMREPANDGSGVRELLRRLRDIGG